MTDFLNFLIAGLSLGAVYALVALGFVVIFRATGVINFAQGSLVVLGAFLVHQFAVKLGWSFPVAVLLALSITAGVAALIERLVMRPLVGQPLFASILVTLGLAFVLDQASAAIWGYDVQLIGDPWGVETLSIGGVTVKELDLWAIAIAGLVLGGFFLLFRRSALGVAMRAAASDPEAALAHGISPRTVHAISWALAGALAVIAAVLIAAGPKGVDLTLGLARQQPRLLYAEPGRNAGRAPLSPRRSSRLRVQKILRICCAATQQMITRSARRPRPLSFVLHLRVTRSPGR